jgi:hypothetical protein
MDWDQIIAYTIAQTTEALGELESGTQPPAGERPGRPPGADGSG